MSKIHNLDESVSEYFEFIVKGHNYRFRHLNTTETKELRDFFKESGQDDVKFREYLYKFISKVNPESPEFSEVANQMIMPQWAKFQEMVMQEFSGK